MNLEDFVKNVLTQINAGVDAARQETSRDIKFSNRGEARTVEFDIAVSAEETDTKKGKAGIKVLQFAEAGGDIGKEQKNSTISRVTFGIDVMPLTKAEQQELRSRNPVKKNSFPSLN